MTLKLHAFATPYRVNSSIRKIRVALLVGTFVLAGVGAFSTTNAQTPEQDLRFNDRILACDDSVALQDVVVSMALEKLKEDAVLFVVIRPGKSDRNNSLTAKRLYNVRQYFRDRGSRLDKKRLHVVSGEPVEGNSRLEYYINGELFVRLIYPPKGFICHSCCGPDSSYYPRKKAI